MKHILNLVIFSMIVLSAAAQKMPSAEKVLQGSYTRAAKENKKIMVIFHASWCVWCHKMEACLNDASVKDYFDKNYVITHLAIQESPEKKNLENPGANELNEKFGGAGMGLPYWIILDEKGNLLADARLSPDINTGCPATSEEVEYFISVLKKTSTITEAEVDAVRKRFRKNEQ